ncbi:hypothetical protein HanHA300_Chr01g0019671 [Helianthus annuus]|nr:hypothetical protein HanHA300_Chr01g0019671 [Helianthus annuus]
MGGFTMTGSDAPGKVIVVPDRLSTFKDLYGLALVGRTVDLETLVDFNKLMKVAKVEYSRLQYIRGLSILISFSDEVSASGFLESRDLWRPWFSKLEVWYGQSLPLERVAWLNLHGTPLHLVDAEVFMQVGELFGKVLHVPNILEGDKDLSYFRVGVLAGEANRIGEVVTIKWKNMRFRVLVEEEQEIWVPDCIDNDNGDLLLMTPHYSHRRSVSRRRLLLRKWKRPSRWKSRRVMRSLIIMSALVPMLIPPCTGGTSTQLQTMFLWVPRGVGRCSSHVRRRWGPSWLVNQVGLTSLHLAL